jgi:hypothetical protein
MDWLELIRASRLLAGGQPSPDFLRRAISTAYYAMFHTLATSNANLVVRTKTAANQSAWTTTYRSLRHFRAENPLYGWVVWDVGDYQIASCNWVLITTFDRLPP